VRNPDGFDVPGITPVKLDVTDPESITAAAEKCSDVTLLINNAGIGSLNAGVLDPAFIDTCTNIFDTNFYGMIRATQAFAPAITKNGGGAVINVLSDATWFSRPILGAYSASKSAAWSFTNGLRVELRDQGIEVLGMHAGFIDTDMAGGVDTKKTDPRDVAAATLEGLENGQEEVLVDEQARLVRRTLSTEHGYYLDPPDIG